MTFNRITGSALVLAGIFGFVTVADDLRHVGEFVGVASIALSGTLLLAGSIEHRLSRFLPARWMAAGILSGMVLGVALDTVVLGVALGFVVGTLAGLALGDNRPTAQSRPDVTGLLHIAGWRFLTASLLPALVGTTLPFWLRPHEFSFRWIAAIEFLTAALLFHAGFSFLLARLEGKSAAFWPVSRCLTAASTCIAAGCLLGLHLNSGLTLHAGVPGGIFIVFGLSTIFVGVLYAVPPLNFSQRIGGEIVLAVGLGLIPVLGAYLVQVGDITRGVYLAALPLVAVTGLWVWTGELVSRVEDERAGRRTMVMIFPLRFSGRYVTLALAILPYAALVTAVFARSSLEPLSLIALLSLGLALKVVSISWSEYADAAKMRRACAYAFAMHTILSLVICLSSLAVILR